MAGLPIALRSNRSFGMRTTLAAAILMGSGVRNAEAHGAMNLPRSRNMGESAFKPSAGGGSVNQAGCDGASCMWFNQGW